MVIRDRVMSTCRQELLDVWIHSRVAVPVRITGPAADIGRPEVGVVTQPKHDIRTIFHDGFEDLGSLSVGLSRTVIERVVHIDAAPRRYSESRWFRFIGPVLLRFELVGLRSAELIAVFRSRLKLLQTEGVCPTCIVTHLGMNHVPSIGSNLLIRQIYGSRHICLDPDQGRSMTYRAQHGARDQFLRSRIQKEKQSGEAEKKCFQW